jgi:hypothetical protein
MKIPVLSLMVSCLLLSCNSKKENNTGNPEPEKKPDSNSIIRTETSVNPYAQVDISPMDMCYFPVDYPKLKMAKAINSLPLARVIYSRPHLQGRHIFHEVLKYGEPWRLGANESTELDLYTDITIMDKKIMAGRYVIYCIPLLDNWTIILNSNIDSWGLEPDPSKDIARFIVPVNTTSNSLEYFTMLFEKTSTGASLIMAWDNVEARLPIVFQ